MNRLWSKLRSHFTSLNYRYDIERYIGIVPEWSTLQTLGQSKVLSLTIFAPFLGSALILNDNVAELLQIPSQLLSHRVGHEIDVRSFSLARLYTIYLGLVFVGAASGLFQITCPNQMRSYKSVAEYIEGESPLITNARRDLLIQDISGDHYHSFGTDGDKKRGILNKLAYPRSISILFNAAFEEIAEATDASMIDVDHQFYAKNPDIERPVEGEFDLDPYGIRVGMRNVIDTDKVAEIICMRRSYERAFWSSFVLESKGHLVDLLTLRYMVLNNSRPLYRMLVSIMYLIGFVALLKPTVETFFIVSF